MKPMAPRLLTTDSPERNTAIRAAKEHTMANIIPHKGPETTPTTWDPFREMTQLFRYDPFKDFRMGEITFNPAFEVRETAEGYVFKADVPGIKESDLDISISGDQITVSGKREAEKENKTDKYYSCERSYGSFARTFTMPAGANADQSRAELKDGVLTIAVPKRPEVQSRKVAIKSPEKTKA